MPTDSSPSSAPKTASQPTVSQQTASRLRAVRSWIMGALFLWSLIGAVAFAAFSSRETGSSASQLALAPAPEADQAGNPPLEAPKSAAATGATPDLSGIAAQVEQKAGGIRWEVDFESAMRRARVENKPIMVNFYTDWCGVCKILDREVLPDPKVIAQSRNWVAVKINGEKRPDVAGAYGVTGYPTIVFAQKSGKPVSILPGMAPTPEFVRIMKEARAKI